MSVPPSFGSQHKVMSGKKRIMVCGGAGFIGCHLCTRLVEMVTNWGSGASVGSRSDLRRQPAHRIQGEHQTPAWQGGVLLPLSRVGELRLHPSRHSSAHFHGGGRDCPAAPIHYQVAAFPPCDCRPTPSRPSSALFSESSTFFIWPATRDAVSCTPARARSTETLSSIPRPVGVIPPSEAQRSTTET